MVYVAYVIYVVYEMYVFYVIYVSYVFLSKNLPFLLFSCLKKQAPGVCNRRPIFLSWRGRYHFAAGAAAAAGAAGASGAAVADAGW